MPVVDGFIKLPPDSTGKAQDFSVVTTSQGSVLRERVNIADSISNNFANVSAAGALQVDGSGVTQPVSIAAAIDVSDRAARLVGHVAVDSLPAVDVTDRAARLMGHVTVDNFPATQPVSGTVTANQGGAPWSVTFPVAQHVVVDSAPTTAVTQGTSPWVVSGTVTASQGGAPWSVDVTDRAARLLGVVYGSQAQQLKQTAVNFNLQVELAAGATLYDARQVRALTSADVVTAAQGAAAALNSKWPVQITDGTNTMPTGDAAARTIHVTVDNASIAVTGTVTANQGGAPWSVDVTDRAARLLGVVYGSQGQQIKQTVTNFNLQVELAAGGTLYDARQVRALTNADVVKAQIQDNAGTAITLGQKAMASSVPVVVASDQASFPVTIAAGVAVIGHVITDAGSVVSSKTDLAPSAPAAASVGVASAQALAANVNRKGLHLINTSSNTISIAFGAAAVLNSGITLLPYGTFWMDEFSFDTGAVNAIASAAGSNLAIQEYA